MISDSTLDDRVVSRPFGFWAYALSVLTGSAILGAWAFLLGTDLREIGRLDPAAREALFARTMANVATCADEAVVHDSQFCAEQARFARLFPECDAACRERTESWLAARR